jgi:CBS domain-containing protein
MTRNPIVLMETSTIEEAALAMREADVGDVLVMRRDEICGILTDRDIVVRFVADGHDPRATFIGEICSTDLSEVRPDDPIEHAIELMRFKAIRRLPVVENGLLVGIVSLGDLACRRDPASALADISSAHANT